MEATAVHPDDVFRAAFTACPGDTKVLIVDVRPHKEFAKKHINHAYCVRLSSNGQVLLDYSQNSYDTAWTPDCWWGRGVIVYGEPGLSKSHPVVQFLAQQQRCAYIYYLREGFPAFEAAYPFLCTASVKAGSMKTYPSQILPGPNLPGHLYLGDWGHAEAVERLEELRIRLVVTIHNTPENLKLPARMKHIRITAADVDTEDLAPHVGPVYEAIEAARQSGHGVLVHCGAGVSRSATLVCAYLMRRFLWSAQQARQHCLARRSSVCPNDGFWRLLCALEAPLGVASRSDPAATSGGRGADAAGLAGPAPLPNMAAAAAALGRVNVEVLAPGASGRKREREGSDGGDGGGGGARGDGRDAEAAKRQRQQGKVGAGRMVTLQVTKPDGPVADLVIGPMRPHQRVLFGRVPGCCDVVLEHASISRQHAELTMDGAGGLSITDLNSAHGTKVNDMWIKAAVPKQLSLGSVLHFGASTRQYKLASVVVDS